MKKVVSLIAAAAMFASVSGATIAADNNPAVYVDGREIFFDDQPAVISEDRTLVPARGVFEAMGAKVDWDGEKRQVQVTSADEQTIVRLVIDDADMKVYDMSGLFAALLAGQDFHAPETVVTLDVPAQIMNDRTMVPLRAISEAVDAQVDWNGEEYCVEIATKDAAEPSEDAPAISLSADVDTVSEGDDFDLFVNLKNVPEGDFVSGVTVVVKYNSENFEFEDASLVNGDETIDALGAQNSAFEDGYVKAVYVTIDAETAAKADGKVMKLTFKSLNGKEGVFSLSNGYQTRLGYNEAILLGSIAEDGHATIRYDGNKLAIDTTPVVVNAVDAEATAEPEATEAPEATAEPEATTAPEATAEPEATTAPETSAEPAATEAPEATAEPTATPAA